VDCLILLARGALTRDLRQLNAVMAHGHANLYSADWAGPPAANYSLLGTSAALAAFVAAIGPAAVANATAAAPQSTPASTGGASPTGGTSTAPAGPSSRSMLARGAKIGIICAVVLAALVGACALAICMRRRRRAGLIDLAEDVGGKPPAMLYAPASLPHAHPEPSPSFTPQERPRTGKRALPATPSALPADVQLLLRRAGPGTAAADLQQRLVELGPIPEVLQALQNLLHSEAAANGELPEYEEGSSRGRS
jgi:hypothetical protein